MSDPNNEIQSKNWTLSINGVSYNIYLGENPESGSYGISESHGQDGRRAVVYFICEWEDRLDMIAGLVGTVEYNAGTIVRGDPASYPISAAEAAEGLLTKRTFGTSILSVQGIKPWRDDEGTFTGVAGWLAYQYAIIQCEFTTPPYLIADLEGFAFNDLTDGLYMTSKIRVSGEVFSPPTGSYKWATGSFTGQPLLDVGAAQFRTRFDVSITRIRMPLVPIQTATPIFGSINQAEMVIGGQAFPTGSLLFTGFNPEPRCDPYNGGIIWDVEYLFLGNAPASNGEESDDPLDWNYFLDPGGEWNKVTTDGGDPVFQYQDHSVLFSDTIS